MSNERVTNEGLEIGELREQVAQLRGELEAATASSDFRRAMEDAGQIETLQRELEAMKQERDDLLKAQSIRARAIRAKDTRLASLERELGAALFWVPPQHRSRAAALLTPVAQEPAPEKDMWEEFAEPGLEEGRAALEQMFKDVAQEGE